jgi:hypothetical protein
MAPDKHTPRPLEGVRGFLCSTAGVLEGGCGARPGPRTAPNPSSTTPPAHSLHICNIHTHKVAQPSGRQWGCAPVSPNSASRVHGVSTKVFGRAINEGLSPLSTGRWLAAVVVAASWLKVVRVQATEQRNHVPPESGQSSSYPTTVVILHGGMLVRHQHGPHCSQGQPCCLHSSHGEAANLGEGVDSVSGNLTETSP